MSGASVKKTVLAGIFLGLHFACFFGALKLTSVANATVFATMAPVFTASVERLYLKRHLKPSVLIGIGMAVVGGLLVNAGGLHAGLHGNLGDGLALLSSIWMALVLMLAEDIRQDTATLIYSRLVYTIAAGTLLLLAIGTSVNVFTFHSEDFLWLVMLGIIPTVIGHTLFGYVIKFIRPTVVASVPLGEPVIASILAWVFLTEAVPPMTLVGGVLTLSGLYLIVRRQKGPKSDFQIDTV